MEEAREHTSIGARPSGRISRRHAVVGAVVSLGLANCESSTSIIDRMARRSDENAGVQLPLDNKQLILSRRPFSVTEEAQLEYFPTWPVRVFTISAPSTPIASGDITDDQAYRLLAQYMENEDTAIRSEMQSIFNSKAARKRVPSSILRLALAALAGTSGHSAVEFILSDHVASVEFSDHSANWIGYYERAIARADGSDDGRLIFSFNAKYRGTNVNPFLFSSFVAHEPLHQDNIRAPGIEEAVAGSIDTFILIEQLSRHELIDSTELGRRVALRAAARINSGTGWRLGLFATNDDAPLIPNSLLFYNSWLEGRIGSGDPIFGLQSNWVPSRGNALLGKYCVAMGIMDAGAEPDFTEELLRKIDQAPYPSLHEEDILRAAKNSGLVT